MRKTFSNILFHQAQKNKKIMLLTGDLGFSVFEEFIKTMPSQYLNAGIAEQNMTGIAAGMAMEGKLPIIYSIVPFITMRNFEQIRNDICYQNLNVKIVGVGAGFSYGPYGHTHHGLEDLGVMRTLANMVILAPGDPVEVSLATKAMLKHVGPVYLRLGKSGEPTIHSSLPKFRIGKGIILKDGKDITIFGTSTMLQTSVEVSDLLGKKGLSVRLISLPCIKPIDTKIILESAKRTRALFTIEEHSIIGGLGSSVAEILAENSAGGIFLRFGVKDSFTKVIGVQDYMREVNGLSPKQISKKIIQLLSK